MYTFSLRVKTCAVGDYLVTRVSEDGFVELKHEDTIIYNTTISHRHAICVNDTDTYHFSYHCPKDISSRKCVIRFYGDHVYYGVMSVLPGEVGHGKFTMTALQKPTFTVPSYFPVIRTSGSYVFTVHVSDIFTYGVLEPKGSDFRFDPELSALTGFFRNEGEFEYSLTIGNDLGNSTVSFTVGVERCPVGTRKLTFIRLDMNDPRENFAVTNHGEIVFSSLLHEDSVQGANLCAGHMESPLIQMMGPAKGWNQRIPIQVRDALGSFGEFQLEKGMSVNERHFNYARVVPANSTLLYSYDVEEGWMNQDYNDHAWKKGSVDTWETNPNKTVLYFRTTFNVMDLSAYSVFYLDVTLTKNATIYLNGKMIAEVIPGRETSQRLTFPLSVVSQHNTIAVSLLKELGEAAIVFDIEAHLATTQSLQISTGGKPVDSQTHPDPDHPVYYAFDNNDNFFWRVYTTPTYVEYSFPNSQKRVVNQVMIRQAIGDHPTHIRIEAVTHSNTTILLHENQSDLLLTARDYDYYTFTNNEAYSAYRLVFGSTAANSTMDLRDIRFMYVKPMQCKKRSGVVSTELNSMTIKRCPLMQVGMREIRCNNVDNQPTWQENTSGCVTCFPPKEIAFIDFTMMIQNLYYEQFDLVKDNFTRLITHKLTVHEEEISFVYLRDVSYPNLYNTEVHVRFTVDSLIGDYIMKYFNRLLPSWSNLIQQYLGDEYKGSIIEEPALRTPVNWISIIGISVIIVLGLFTTFYYYVRRKSVGTVKSLRKSKRRSKTPETEALL